MNPSANTVEVHLPQAGISKMVWAISLFSLTGLIASLVALGELSNPWRGFPKEPLIFAFLACLLFVFGVAGLLVWQLARLVGAYKESVRHTINRAQFESLAPPPQAQPVYIPASNISSPSVVEHTTRQMGGRHKEPIARD
jgi:hypothetical protein